MIEQQPRINGFMPWASYQRWPAKTLKPWRPGCDKNRRTSHVCTMWGRKTYGKWWKMDENGWELPKSLRGNLWESLELAPMYEEQKWWFTGFADKQWWFSNCTPATLEEGPKDLYISIYLWEIKSSILRPYCLSLLEMDTTTYLSKYFTSTPTPFGDVDAVFDWNFLSCIRSNSWGAGAEDCPIHPIQKTMLTSYSYTTGLVATHIIFISKMVWSLMGVL